MLFFFLALPLATRLEHSLGDRSASISLVLVAILPTRIGSGRNGTRNRKALPLPE